MYQRTMTRASLIQAMVLLAWALLTVNAQAASPSEELNRMVQQLQSNPSDDALREKVIKQAQRMRPAPAITTEAKRRMARGQAAFEMAKNLNEFENAITEYQAAANAAPWVADIYYNLGTIYEKANKPAEAMASFKLYQKAAPTARDSSEIEQRIFKLEFMAEQKAKEEQAAQRAQLARQKTQNLVDSLNRLFGGKNFWYTKICAPPGHVLGENLGCNREERDETNWYTLTNSDRPDVLSFSMTSDGKIQFFTGFPSPVWQGSVQGDSVEEIRWKALSEGKELYPVWIKMNDAGEWYKVCPYTEENPDNDPTTRMHCAIYTTTK